VASFLCPAHLRPAVAAIYWFARTGDDLADEGDVSAGQRLRDLAQLRSDLLATAQEEPHSGRWPQVLDPLHGILLRFKLPTELLTDLLDAFGQDVEKTRDQTRYADQAELLDYCRRSANPVGRLMLHLYGVHDALSLARSDAICSALQLINFWQDLSRDIPRGRHYLTELDCRVHGVRPDDLQALRQTPAATGLIAEQCRLARSLMLQGAPLVHSVPGRAGWELRLMVQGGLRILDKIAALDYGTLQTRPALKPWDLPLMLWRACRMRATSAPIDAP
jgi:squalene synthase HpnC